MTRMLQMLQKTNQRAYNDPCPPFESAYNEHGCRNWTLEQSKKVARSDDSRFILRHVDGHVCVLLEK